MTNSPAGNDKQKSSSPPRRSTGVWWNVLGWTSAIVILAVPVAAILISYATYAPPSAPLATLTLTRHPAAGSLAVWTTAPAARWESAKPLPLSSFFSNASNAPITVLLSLNSPPGCPLAYQLQNPDPAVSSPGQSTAGPVSVTVKPESQTEAVLLIHPSNCPAVRRETGVPLELHYTWIEPSQGKPPSPSFAAVASVSPIVFAASAASTRWTQALQAGYSAFKDLSWPVVMLLFGVILKKISDYREESQSRRQDRQQILTNLLPEYVRLVQQHYMPITRRIETVHQEWGKIKKNLQAQKDKAAQAQPGGAAQAAVAAPRQLREDDPSIRLLAAILLFRSRSLALLIEKGGVFFRTSIGENLFALGVSEFFTKCRSIFGTDPFESAALALDPKSTLPASVKALLARPNMFEATSQQADLARLISNNAGMDEFDAWIKSDPTGGRSFDRFVNLLSLCGEVLLFECDRIFYQTDPNQDGVDDGTRNQTSGWYFDPPKLEVSREMLRVPAAKPERGSEEGSDGYSEETLLSYLQDYMSRVPEDCRVGANDGDESDDFDALLAAITNRLHELAGQARQ